MCGCFISDDEYVVELEGKGASVLLDIVGSTTATPAQINLLGMLQHCHDIGLVVDWKANLEGIATKFKLSPEVLSS